MQSFTLSSSLGPFVDTHIATPTSTLVMTPSASPTGAYAGTQGSADISAMLLQGWEVTPANLMFFNALALTLVSIVMTIIWTETITYFEYFHHTDSGMIQGGVLLGTALTTSCFVVNLVEVQQIAYHAATDFVTIMRFLVFAELYIKLLSCLLILVAGSYFGWRAWKLSGRKPIFIPIFVVLVAASLGMGIYTLVRGFPLPPLRIDALRRLGPYFINTEHANHQWAWVVMGCDAFTCLTLIVLLWRSKESLFNTETALIRRLVGMTMESMTPPTIVLVILSCGKECAGSWIKIFSTILPVLYWQSLLYALVSRHSIRKLLHPKLASSGIDKLSRGSGHPVYVHTPRDARAWHDEERGELNCRSL